MRLIGYMNAPTEPDLLALKHGMGYLMHHPHEPIMYAKIKRIKLIGAHTNATSKQGMNKSIKIRNIPTSFTLIVMQIMEEIYLADAQ